MAGITPAVDHIICHCGSLSKEEKLLIICDPTTRTLSEQFLVRGRKITKAVQLIEIPLAKTHGEPPPAHVSQAMLESNLILSLCSFSLAHSQARIDAGNLGVRFLSLPQYTEKFLLDPSIMFNFKSQAPTVRKISDAFTLGREVLVTAEGGTDVTLRIDGREGNFCPGFVDDYNKLGSPPDIESNVSPLEDHSEGVIVVDGSITCPEIGLVTNPVTLFLENGSIKKFESENSRYLSILEKIFDDSNPKRRVLAECGVGLNPMATLTGSMLSDEGALGCIHFGFGSNSTVGGINEVDFHLDFVVRRASLRIDEADIIREGLLQNG